MDFSRLDRVRRSATPLELDVVEAYANGRITRRQFIQRATVIGLSLPAIGAVIAACGPGTGQRRADAAGSQPGTSEPASAPASVAGGGTIRGRHQRPVGIDPVAMQDLGGYGIVAQSMEFLCTLNTDGSDIDMGLATEWTTNETARSGPSSSERASSGRTGPTSRRPTSWPRWSVSLPPETPA